MSSSRARRIERRKARMLKKRRRIDYRLRPLDWEAQDKPMFAASNIDYEISDRTRGLSAGGIGAIHLLARRLGLIDAIDEHLELLKVHLPYHESDHVLNIAYNILCGGTCLQDIELRRNDEVFLDCLGAQRIPDPTTAGDFCRRFKEEDVELLQEVFNEIRLSVWGQQPESFLDEAVIDADGTLAPTNGECKEGMDISHKGTWGYHPLVVSLANTGEPLYLVNRSGNRPSHEDAAEYIDRAIALCRRAGFRRITIRGDTDFSQTQHLDRWNRDGVRFVFGYDVHQNLVAKAQELPKTSWCRLQRREKYEVKTEPRARRERVKERVVVEREYKNFRLQSERVAEFEYSPTKCELEYWMVALEKNVSVEEGERVLFDQLRYLFYITNCVDLGKAEVVFSANDRCNQENLIEQLKNGVKAMRMPVDNLVSNWAYMVMASLAWSLKAWFALMLPERGRWGEKYKAEKTMVLKMEFKSFLNSFLLVPAQIVKTGRKIVFRLLAWNRNQHIFLRALEALNTPLRC